MLELSPFWDFNPWEPTVQLAVRDWCRPGEVAYDVGTNVGGIAAVMSRMVGPRGVVAAFEASPRIIGIAAENLRPYANVFLNHRAVWRESGNLLTLYSGGAHLNDSLLPDYMDRDAQSSIVETLTLDAFRAETRLDPSFIKMDIEGAEFDALSGAQRLLDELQPIIVLEIIRADSRCLELLLARGYRAVDLASLMPVASAADLPAEGVANILFAPAARAEGNPYYAGVGQQTLEKEFGPDDFTVRDKTICLHAPHSLAPGRYAFSADMDPGDGDEVFAGAFTDRGWLARYHATSRHLMSGYTTWMFDLAHKREVDFGLQFLGGSPSGVTWRGGRLTRFKAFDEWPRRLVI